MSSDIPRGIRNNNPANLRRTKVVWQGESLDQTDPDYLQFTTATWGIRAMTRVLMTYEANGYTTIDSIINRWAPTTENDTGAYIQAVSCELGVSPNDVIDFTTQMPALVKAIIRHENGEQPYPESVIDAGIAMA